MAEQQGKPQSNTRNIESRRVSEPATPKSKTNKKPKSNMAATAVSINEGAAEDPPPITAPNNISATSAPAATEGMVLDALHAETEPSDIGTSEISASNALSAETTQQGQSMEELMETQQTTNIQMEMETLPNSIAELLGLDKDTTEDEYVPPAAEMAHLMQTEILPQTNLTANTLLIMMANSIGSGGPPQFLRGNAVPDGEKEKQSTDTTFSRVLNETQPNIF